MHTSTHKSKHLLEGHHFGVSMVCNILDCTPLWKQFWSSEFHLDQQYYKTQMFCFRFISGLIKTATTAVFFFFFGNVVLFFSISGIFFPFLTYSFRAVQRSKKDPTKCHIIDVFKNLFFLSLLCRMRHEGIFAVVGLSIK